MYSAILFDLDGTLVDTVDSIEWAARQALHEVLPAVPYQPIRTLIGPQIDVMFCNYLVMHAPQLDAGASRQKAKELVASYRKFYDGEGCIRCRPFSDVEAVLTSLHHDGIRCFVVTNKPQLPTGKIIPALALKKYFEAVVSPDSRAPIYENKTEMVRALLEEYNLPKAGVLFVGDAMDDARAAYQNAIDFAAVMHGYGGAHLQSDFPVRHTIDDLSELLKITRATQVSATGVLAP